MTMIGTTGLTVRQVFPDTFDEHVNMVGRGEIDISFSNPFVYVKIADRYGARAFARVVETAGQVAHAHRLIVGLRQVHEDLVVAERSDPTPRRSRVGGTGDT